MKLKKSNQEQLWAEAQRRCRLSDEAVRMAKELGIGPRSLIKNTPSSKEQWKAPVEDWVRDIYQRRHSGVSRPGKEAKASTTMPSTGGRPQVTGPAPSAPGAEEQQ